MRIAIVNDLALARETLRRLVLSSPGHTIAWIAHDGAEAIARARADRPDLILMDLVMPVMNGVEATRRIMSQSPCPILIVTSSVATNFNMVYEAMGCGGLDAVNTPTLKPDGTVEGGRDILDRMSKLARASLGTVAPIAPAGGGLTHPHVPSPAAGRLPILAIGASTGGPAAVAEILKNISPLSGIAAVLIQHIAADFAPSLANWLAGQTRWPVHTAHEGSELRPGHLLVAATNDHLILKANGKLSYTANPHDYPYRPSVDVFFQSLAIHAPQPGVAVLLTGMGSDGAAGLGLLRASGWHTIAQNEATCVVYGMPRAAVERDAAVSVLPLNQIAGTIRNQINAQTQ